MNWYVTRDHLKRALDIPATSTGKHALLGAVIESVSRQIDAYVGFSIAPSCATRDYTAENSTCLYLDYPLLAVDSILGDNDENASFETTIPTTGVRLAPYNASVDGRPFWEVQLRNASAVFPEGVHAGTRIAGTWGYTNNTSAAATLATALTATATSVEMTPASAIEAGHTIIIGTERMFVNNIASGTSAVAVVRGVNGTSGTTHSSGVAVSFYNFGVFNSAALYQAELDYRAMEAPLGFSGDVAFGTQRPNAPGGLHPFTRRMLDVYRMPVAQ